MHGNIFIHSTERYLSVQGKNSQPSQSLPPNAICVSCIATVGLVALTTRESQTNQQINSIICNDNISYLYIFMILRNMKDELQRLGAGGSTTLNVSKSLFSSIELQIPKIDVMNKFHKNTEPLFKQILLNEQELSHLAKLKQLLISQIAKKK